MPILIELCFHSFLIVPHFSFQAIGQVLFLRPYVNDFSTEWVISSVILLTLGSAFTTYIGERITDLKLGNGTSLLIFTNIISYLPASFGRTFSEAFNDANYVGLATIIVSFFLLVVGIVYVQVNLVLIVNIYVFDQAERSWSQVSTMIFRKRREKYLLIMLLDSPEAVDLKNLLTYPLRFSLFCQLFYVTVSFELSDSL